jgi:hypothetical protein
LNDSVIQREIVIDVLVVVRLRNVKEEGGAAGNCDQAGAEDI